MENYWRFKKKKWFFEVLLPYEKGDVQIGLKIKKKLYSGRSPFQKIKIYELEWFGRTLVLDEILQTTEND